MHFHLMHIFGLNQGFGLVRGLPPRSRAGPRALLLGVAPILMQKPPLVLSGGSWH